MSEIYPLGHIVWGLLVVVAVVILWITCPFRKDKK